MRPDAASGHGQARSGAPAPGFTRAVLAGTGARALLLGQCAALVLALARYVQQRSPDETLVAYLMLPQDRPPYVPLGPHWLVEAIAALCIVLAMQAAHEALRRGARLRTAWLLPLLAASLAAAAIQWLLRSAIGGDYAPPVQRPLLHAAVVAIDVAMLGGLVMIARVKRLTEQGMLLDVRRAELRRAQREGRLIESRMAASSAQVSTEWLLERLALVRQGYARGDRGTEAAIDALIADLQMAVARASSAASSLE